MGDFFKKHKEIILYVVFGIITTVLSWGLYALFANALKMSVFASSAVSWIIVITVAFITNKLFVFESKAFNLKVLLKEASSFLASRAATGVIEVFGVPLLEKTGFDNIFFSLVTKIGLKNSLFFTPGIYSKAVLVFIVVLLNYVFSKLVVFKNKSHEEKIQSEQTE